MHDSAPAPLTRSLALTLAIACGVAAANVYYNQPLLPLFARDLGVTRGAIGSVPALVQVGYGIGLWVIVPFGDLLERKRMIVLSMLGLTLVQLATALAPSLAMLDALSLLIGILASVTQQIVALVAHLAAPERRGRAVGTVMMGLMLGILLSRTVGGALADWQGWRATYLAAAVVTFATAVLLVLRLPRMPPATRISYARLVGSLLVLLVEQPQLRRSVLAQAMLYGAFSAFWATMSLMLEQPPYRLGSAVAGLFGLVAAAGALMAPLVGRMADQRGSSVIVLTCTAMVFLSFLLMGAWQGSLVALIVGVVFMDMAVQAGSVGNITRIHALDPAARGRLTAVLVGTQFAFGAFAAFLANRALIAFGWSGVCAFAGALGLLGLGGELFYRRRGRQAR